MTLKTYFRPSPDSATGGLAYLGAAGRERAQHPQHRAVRPDVYDLAIAARADQSARTWSTTAYDSPIDHRPPPRSRRPSRRSTRWPRPANAARASSRFPRALTRRHRQAANAYQRNGGLPGVATGFNELDRKLGGLQTSDLIILAGRPAMGKTALATNIAYQRRQGLQAPTPDRWHGECARRRAWSPSSRWKCRPSSSPPA